MKQHGKATAIERDASACMMRHQAPALAPMARQPHHMVISTSSCCLLPSPTCPGLARSAAARLGSARVSRACINALAASARSSTETDAEADPSGRHRRSSLVTSICTCVQGLTLVPISAQLELFCPPCNPTHECVLEMLKLSSNVNECKPLPAGSGIPTTGSSRHVASRRRRSPPKKPPSRSSSREGRGRCVPPRRPPPPRGLHSSTFQLNLSAFYGIRGAQRACVAVFRV